MPIARSVIRDTDTTVLTVSGEVTPDEMKRAIEQFWEAEHVTLDVIWDYSAASMARLQGTDLGDLVDVGLRYPDRLRERAGGRTAIIAPSDVAYGMMRISETLSEMAGYTFEVRVFRSREAGEAWLAEPGRNPAQP
ncbi:MAG: STAS/SEC14 domain-containing protein [Deltaproteobacteria bacterium]|jgi:hypothetical protein|nr:STAS/SEC14 domain-containing protein [Deltaproteobacteria bacterium]